MAYDISTSYDTIGNLTSKSGLGSYTYGANGNLMSGGNRTFTWTADNLPASVTSGGVTESYVDDADGERVAHSRRRDHTSG